jgi:hypothetical protein
VLVATTVSHAFSITYEPLLVFNIRSGPRYGKFSIVQEQEQATPADNKSYYISRVYLLGYKVM